MKEKRVEVACGFWTMATLIRNCSSVGQAKGHARQGRLGREEELALGSCSQQPVREECSKSVSLGNMSLRRPQSRHRCGDRDRSEKCVPLIGSCREGCPSLGREGMREEQGQKAGVG